MLDASESWLPNCILDRDTATFSLLLEPGPLDACNTLLCCESESVELVCPIPLSDLPCREIAALLDCGSPPDELVAVGLDLPTRPL